jgi:hypothetical protein
MGLLEVTFGGTTKTQHKVRLVWQIDEAMDDGRRFIVQKRYTLSLHKKANLRKDLESWRGRAFTEEELAGFDLEVLLDVNCFLNIVHVVKDSATYANVASIMPLKKGMAKMDAEGYIRVQDRKPEGDEDPTPVLTDDDIAF